LYYANAISKEGFKAEEQRIMLAIKAARERATEEQLEHVAKNDLELRFEQVARTLRELDIEAIWSAANLEERRVLIHELLEWVAVFPDHLEVKVSGAPPINVLLGEVGLKVPENVGVGGPTSTISEWRLRNW
jgi:hypothetical protein